MKLNSRKKSMKWNVADLGIVNSKTKYHKQNYKFRIYKKFFLAEKVFLP